MKRVIKYYTDRSKDNRAVEQIILAGGSASMPGLVDFLSEHLGAPTSIADPWAGLELKHIQAVSKLEAPMYTTAIGLARLEGEL